MLLTYVAELRYLPLLHNYTFSLANHPDNKAPGGVSSFEQNFLSNAVKVFHLIRIWPQRIFLTFLHTTLTDDPNSDTMSSLSDQVPQPVTVGKLNTVFKKGSQFAHLWAN